MSTRFYEYRHTVGLQETNVVGNVYYTNHLAWQGRCREMFLREHAPDVMEELSRGLALATVNCSCEYLAELNAFDEVIIRMRLVEMIQNRVQMAFEYFRRKPDGTEELVARGEQRVAAMRREQERMVPTPLPQSLRAALAAFVD